MSPATSRITKFAAISGGLAGILTPWLFIIPLLGDVDTAKEDHSASVEAQGIAVEELQGISGELVSWGKAHDGYHTAKLELEHGDRGELKGLRDRVAYLEGYIKATSNGRYDPKDAPRANVSVEPAMPEQRVLKISDGPKAPAIKTVDKAKRYRNLRRRNKCGPKDPGCGARPFR
jgi:hypothetical protein